MISIKNLIHRQTLAKLNYYKKFHSIGIKFDEYCDYIYGNLNTSFDIVPAKLYGVEVKRINSYSFVQNVEEVLMDEVYKFKSDNQAPLIIDCGANIGLSIIYFKRLYPKARIIGFEPDTAIFDACKFNLDAFGLSDVELVNAAIWKNDGVLNFMPNNSLGGMVVEDTIKNNRTNEVKAVDLKRYLKSKVDFLKIDIEGAEVEVLSDCRNELSSVKQMFVEYHSVATKPQELQVLLQVISNAGFRYYIKHAWDYMKHPFIDHNKDPNMSHDLQLNIFAYRI